MKSRQRNHLIAAGVSRRKFLERAGLATGAVLLAPAILAACGGDDDDSASSGGSSGGGGGSKDLKVSNWTGYMTDQSLKDFEKTTGISVDYAEDINDNNEYFTKIRPNLSKGKGTGRDSMVLTDWMASRLINQVDPPWVQPLDTAKYPEPEEPHPRAAERGLGPDAQVQRAVGHRHDRHRVQHQDDRQADHVDRRLPRRERHEDGAHRDARHRRALHARRWHRSHEADVRRRPAPPSMRLRRR